MEAGTGYICEGNGRKGSWFSYAGPQSSFLPAGAPVPPSALVTPRSGSTRGMRAHGTNGDYAGFGCWLTPTPATYDAHGYTGIRFWAMGTPTSLKVVVQTSATESTTFGGTCTLPASSCAGNEHVITLSSSAWTQFSVPFSALTNGTVSFNSSDVWSIEFQTLQGSGAFDFWIDDLEFY
jgi:hypothetical protein